MSKLSEKDVGHVAKLAKLKLSKEEIKKFKSQLSTVIEFVEELNEVDTDNVEPTSQTTGLINVFRKDEIKTEDCLDKEEATSGTDNVKNFYFVVPGVFSERNDE